MRILLHKKWQFEKGEEEFYQNFKLFRGGQMALFLVNLLFVWWHCRYSVLLAIDNGRAETVYRNRERCSVGREGETLLASWLLPVPTINTLRTGDADLCFYITTVQDGWRKSAFLTSACFPCTIHLIMQYIEPVSEWSCWRMFIETWPHSELNFRHRASSI